MRHVLCLAGLIRAATCVYMLFLEVPAQWLPVVFATSEQQTQTGSRTALKIQEHPRTYLTNKSYASELVYLSQGCCLGA